jgi:hypothetical protein
MPDDAKTSQRRDAAERTKAWNAACATAFEENQRALGRWLEDTKTLSSEMSDLARSRMRFAMDAWAELAACRNPEQLVECYEHLIAKTAEQFAAETTKLQQLALTMSSLRSDRS